MRSTCNERRLTLKKISSVNWMNLEKDESKLPFEHPSVKLLFDGNDSEGNYIVKQSSN